MSVIRCSVCGAEVLADSRFCHQCGESVSAGESMEGDDGVAPTIRRESVREPSPQQRFSSAVDSVSSHNDDEESELWEGGYSAKAMYGSWLGALLMTIAVGVGSVFLGLPIGAIVFGAFLLVCWGGLALLLAIRKLSVRYKLTSQRFVHRSGILKQVTDRIEVIDMDDVTYEQGIIQRMLGVGTIRIASSDRSHPELVLIGIDDVRNIATQIDDIRRKERRRRGLHIEAI